MASSRTAPLTNPLTLPCGKTLKNRLLKSAMSESMATPSGRVTKALPRLYGRWAAGGCGTLVTGNVMVDKRALVEPQVVVLENAQDLPQLHAWAQAGQAQGTLVLMQLSHPGKQTPKGLNRETVAPSAVPFAGPLRRLFATPRALTEAEIEDLIERFGRSAELAQQAGFGGVQVHGAHGYLVSQFLSPRHNLRRDAFGGTATKRMAFVLAIYDRIRLGVGPSFPVSIKLNSADFQRGGFGHEESLDVISALVERGVDLLEISGGTYEAPAMAQGPQKASTQAREAYFLEFAAAARSRCRQVPLCVTGGFRSTQGMLDGLQAGIDLVGLARPLAVEPDLPQRLFREVQAVAPTRQLRTGIGPVDDTAFMEVAWYARQLHRLGRGKAPRPNEQATLALGKILLDQGVQGLRTRLAKH